MERPRNHRPPPHAAAERRSGSEAAGTPGIAWTVERVIPGATVAPGEEPYKLLLDGNRLRELQPQRPERIVPEPGEDSRAVNARRREADILYRDQNAAYRELVDAVRSLPTRIEAPRPDVAWAVFEVNALGEGFTIRNAQQDWTVSFEDWELLSGMASGTGSGGGGGGSGADLGSVSNGVWSADQIRTLGRLSALTSEPSAWCQRALAVAVVNSGLTAHAVTGDAAFKLVGKLLQSKDTIARNRVAYHLATATPTTPAIAQLLEDAAKRSGDPAVALAALRARLAVDLGVSAQGGQAGNTQGLSAAVASTNAVLANPAGPPADAVLRELLTATATPNGGGGSDETDNLIASGVRFDKLPPDRFDAAVGEVIRAAADRPVVAGGWLNRQLLGSNNPAVARRTLELLARADAPSHVVRPISRGLRALVFKPLDADGDQTSEDIIITAGLPLDSANHALFKFLQAGDPALRSLGWQVLRHFELTDTPAPGSGGPAEAGDRSDPLALIVTAGLSRPDTPASLVPFLSRQPDLARATGPLLRIVRWGDVASSRRAARSLLGSGRELGPDIAAMSSEDRAYLADRFYDRLGSGPEPVVDLLRLDQGQGPSLVNWFAKSISDGILPPASEYGPQVGSTEELCRLATAQEDPLARGAIAALTALAGGDRALQYKMIDRFKEERKKLDTPGMVEAWSKARQDIYVNRLAAAKGDYRLTMTVTGRKVSEGGAGMPEHSVLGNDPDAQARQAEAAAADVTQRVVLGVVTLKADGQTVAFSGGTPTLTVPDDRLAIRIATPAQLKNFPMPEISELPLENSTEPLDLLPQDNGAWKGTLTLSDGRPFELLLEPISKASEGAEGAGGDKKDDKDATKRKKLPQGGDLKRNPF